MSEKFIYSCESTVDLPFSYVDGRGISVLFYTYQIDGKEYVDDMGRDPEALPAFYGEIDAGRLPTTSQINTYRYVEYFDKLMQQGKDVLHVAFGTGMTPSYNNAIEAAETIRKKYPDQKLIVVDSFSSCGGYGLLVDDGANLRDEGKDIEEVAAWLRDHAKKVHHHFFSTDFRMFKRSGRVSGAAAIFGTLLGICPVMKLNNSGHMVAYTKVRGRKNAIRDIVKRMGEYATDGFDYSGRCFINNANCPELAQEMKTAIEENFPNLVGKIKMYEIGTIIASHCGPGTVAVFFYGDERA